MGLNHVYKVVWNKTKGCYVVVSELAKRVGRNKAKAIVMSTAAMAMAVSPVVTSTVGAVNDPGIGAGNSVAWGANADATGGASVALGTGSKATGNDAYAIGSGSNASAARTISIGNRSTASGNDGIAVGTNTQATATNTVAIGKGSKAEAVSAVALGEEAKASQARSIAIGKAATIVDGQDTIAIGTDSVAAGHNGIAIGKNAKITDKLAEGTVVIGRDAFSEGSGRGDRPNTVVGRGAYTAFGENGTYRLNASTAFGFQAGAGVIVDPKNNRKLVNNNTNADTNATVLVKAGYGLDVNAPAETKATLQSGTINEGLVFYRKNHINEATALGAEARAVGDQSIAIGAQVVAGDGVVALGGNDTDQLRGNRYQVVTEDAVRRTDVSTIDDYNLAYTESERTVEQQYNKLVGRGMPTAYKSTYGQSGSVVIGMEAHSTTALGTAIGTNSVVRMGAFGATAIGAGSTVQANAEAAVAIGMGSVANGAYALAAGTASWAELGDIAMGYKAKASGKQGAIAIGQATNAKGDSSVMIGGANISNAADQAITYEAEKKNPDGSRETYTKNVTERINGQDVTRKYTYVSTERKNGKVSDAYAELTGKTMNTSELDYNRDENKNGHASTSVGVHSLAKGDLASAYGASSRASAVGSLALGTGAIADKQNAVAIGTGSTTDLTGTRQLDASYDKDGKWVASDSPEAVYTFKWAGGLNTSEGDVVSFGSSGAERQLKNVAAGRIAEDSTDAINGSQVNAVIEKFIADGVKYFSVNSTVEPNRQNKGATGTDAIAIGPSASATNTNALATGTNATATGDSATAYGAGTKASETGAVAIGSTITKPDATKASTEATGTNATAVGAGAQATALDSTAVGALSEAKAEEAIAIGSKAKSESVAGVAIGQNAQVGAAATQGLALGQNTTVSAVGGVALGTGSVASVASGVSGIGVDGEAEGTDRVNKYAKLHSNADNALTSGQGAISVGGTVNNNSFTRQITGVAAGTNNTDAVNVAQLKSVNLAFKGNTGTGDVRLYDQRLTVKSDNVNLLTVTASDKTLTLSPKTIPLTVDSTAGSTTLGKVTVPDATNNGLVTAADVANAINAVHWNVATSASTATGTKHTGDSNKAVHAGETVKFIAGEHVTIDQNGRDITVSMKDAVTYVMLNDKIQSSFENGNNTVFNVNPENGKLRFDVTPTATFTSVQTGDTVLKNGVVSNLKDHLPSDAITSGTKPVLDEGNKEGNQASTVNDVLNAGWNLQNNDVPKDFVKPYDTVTFNDGVNTSAVVAVSPDGKKTQVRFNVTGLPITYTTETGAPVSKVGNEFYTVTEDGIPVGPNGNKAIGKNAAGDVIDEQGNIIPPIDITKTPLKTNLVNPNIDNTTGDPNSRNITSTQLGNVDNGGVTHNLHDANGTELKLANDGKYYDATKVNPDGSTMTGVTEADAKTPVVLANDGKWYPKDKVTDRGELKDPTATPVVPGITAAGPTAGLIDFGKSNPNNVATIGDLRNMGWVVSAPTNGYLDQVRNANQVDFVGKNGITVTGETKNGIRTITVETAEEAVVFKAPDGTPLVKTETGYFPEDSVKIDGNYYPANTTKDPVTGNITNNGAPARALTPIQSKDVVTSMNSSTPKTLNNVKNTLPSVNDGTKTVTNADGTPGANPGDVSNITKAPITAEEAAKLANPTTANGQTNPNYQGSNAATVSDVLHAGWNLRTNGTALDFVKPYDTVNFINGANTTIESSTDGTTSKIQVNVTGLPVSNTITDAQGNQVPVVKVGNTYFPVKADGAPDIQRDAEGNPTNGYTIADDGNIYPSNQMNFIQQPDGSKTVTPRGGTKPTTLNTNLVNPNVTHRNPTAGVNTPTTVGNVNNGAAIFNPISTTGVPLRQAIDGKWYEATKVDEQGNKLPDADAFEGTPAVLANDGKWYEAGKVDAKGTPKADAQPIANPLTNKIANGGLINFANSNPNNVATVGDLQNMGWIVGTPRNNYADQVRNANQVNFIGTNGVSVTGETNTDGIRTVIIDVHEQKTVEAAHTPVVYTDGKGNKLTKLDNGKFYDAQETAALGPKVKEVDGRLYPADALEVDGKYYPADTIFIDGKPYPKGSVKHDDGSITNPRGLDYKALDGVAPVTDAKASMNDTEGSTTNPFPLANVGSNLKQVVDPKENLPGKVNDKDGETKVGDVTNKAPYTAQEAAAMTQRYELNADGTIKTEKVPVIDRETGKQKVTKTKEVDPQTGLETEVETPVFEDKKVINANYIGNNAATVSDVLNTGWNLQNNGDARDFVKPYDTVNFVNGANTTAMVTTSEDGSTSKVTFNVTGLPVTYTDTDGKPVSKVGDKFYKVNDKGEPISDAGKPAVKTNDDGKLVDEDDHVIEPIDPAATPLKTALTNPAPEKDKTSTTSPTALNNVKNNIPNVNDGTEEITHPDGTVDSKTPNKANITKAPLTAAKAAELSNPKTADGAANPNYIGNNAATVSDVLNAGWNLQNNGAAKDFVKPFDTVNFVNGGNTTAVVTTNAEGTTSDVTYNVTGLPVTYTTETGAPVSKVGDKFYTVDESGTPVGPTGKKAVGKNATGDFIDDAGNVITPINITEKPLQSNLVNPNVKNTNDAPNNQTTTPTQLGNVANGAKTFAPLAADGTEATDAKPAVKLANDGKWYPADQVEPNGKPKENATPVAGPVNVAKSGLIDFTNSNPNNAATIGDLQNMGWVVSAEGNSYSDQVRNANEVKFVGEGKAIVTGKTDANGVRTITVKVEDQDVNHDALPVVYTKADGTQVYPVKSEDGTITYHTTPDGKGENDKVVPNGDVNTSINGPKDEQGNIRPASLGNVKNNIPTVNDEDKKAYNVDGTPIADKNNTAAPITAADAADLLKPMKDGKVNPNFVGNNAATVSDVLNAGWNLQGNGKAVDFVKPFDTVNFRDGGNTTVTVTTDDNLTSHVQVNVTGLPVANTITDPTTGKQVPVVKVGDTFYPANPDGTPNIQKDAKTGEPTNGYVRADDGKFYPREDVDVTPAADPTKPATVTPKEGKTPTTVNTNLANPNVANTTDNPGNNVNTPSQLGNVANGANTFSPVDADGNEYVKANNGKYYAPDKVNEDGSLKEGTDAVADAKDPLVLANDGKWYKSSEVRPNGTPIDTATSVQPPKNTDAAGLVDFSKSNPNNAATVGDLQNLGWIVSAEGNDYTDQVRNANEVRFVGAGSATVTGETDKNGVRTITVSVDDQVSTNNAITPVNYTTADGTKVYPLTDEDGNVTYHTTSDGTGDGDQVIAPDNVITSLNGPKGTKSPTTLNNVKNNIPAVNDADKKVTNPDGTEAPNAGDVTNINKAPLTAEKAADLLKPTTKDGKPNPNFVGNNAATVSDVLNAGWNLQNNGEARDFVKPFDTVNFVNGGNTTAVVTTKADGTTSDVTFNVTGLPIATTITDPTTGKQVPVVKVGDTFYPANPDGTPNIARNDKGEPTNGYVRANDGKLYPREAVTVTPSADPTKPPTVTPNTDAKPTTVNTNLANPNVDNTTNEPGNNVNTPTQLGNVANGAETFKPADDVKLANDGKWYPADQVEANGKPKKDATPVANPLAPKNADGDVLAKGNDGNWYKASDLENGEPKPNVDEQTPVAKPANTEKAGLVNFENSNPNNAATVGDLQNLGFVVAAHDNGYTEQMRNTNKVEFKGSNGVQVTGKTLKDGTREITVALKEGRVTNDVVITSADGTETHAVRGEDGKIYQKDPKTGKATTTEIPVAPTDTVTNDGNSYVTGNSVATAIQKSGWGIGIGSTTQAFSTEEKVHEKVNPSDKVKYVNGDNTTVSMAVDEAKDKDGTKVTTTYVKVDVNRDLKIDSVTAGGPAKDGVPGKDGAITVKDAAGKDGVSATAKDGKGTLTLNNAKAGKDGNDAASVAISTDKAPADLDNTPKDAVRANDGKWYAPADVDVKTENGKTVVTPKAGKSPMADAPTMDRIQYTGTDKKVRDVATMDDGLRFQGDDGESISKPLNSTVQLTGGNRAATGKPVAKDATTTGNIGVFNADGKLSVQLAKDLDKLNSANFESKTDKAGNPVTMIDGKYYKATDLENGKPKTGAKPVEGDNLKAGPNSKLTGTGLVVTPETAKVVNPKTGEVTVDPTKIVSFGAPSIAVNPNTGKTMVDANGNPVMKSGISAGGQVIANVAPGVENTDAVNVSQLKGVTNAVVNISNHINGLGAQMNRVGAQAAAMAGLRHLQYDPLEPTTIMAGVGIYKGEGALALGVAHYKNESTLFHAGASIGSRGDELMANAGVSWKFGARADETAVKDTFRQGPISSSYTLQDKVSALEAQNKIQKDQLNELRATNAAQKAENEAQREELALMKAQIAELFKRMNG